ncbi:hypothetical protein HYC85_024231 [Camellia sinensis]|uniref:CDT1 Geminin-binding domain-containing protein n=1 Tax=Camellia sinensis TaxID=4442 RepID=A0A7J7G8T0_CAMSI|nr:hypothetical protein HYC85_024231 [Camellia sinensis]
MESSGSLPFDSKLQKSDRDQPDKVRSDGNEVASDTSAAQVGKSKRKSDGQIKLPEKFEILGKFFDSLDSSIRLLRLKGSGSTFANISPKMECLTDRRFSYGHLAQLKFILPEVIEIKKILVHDEKTSCMKLDLHVTLNVDAIKNERKPNASGNSHMRKVFHARLLDFFKAHPKGEVPEETLPEPFNQLKQDVHISTAKASDPSLLRGTLADALAEQQPTAAASHLSQPFRKRFSQKISRSEAVDGYQGQPIVSLQPSVIPVPEPHFDQSSSEELTGASASKFSLKATTSQKCLPIGASRASILRSLPSATPKIEIDFGKNKVCSSVETAIIQGTPAKPALQPQKRCYVSPDDDSTSSPRKLVTRKPQSRSLKFDTPVKNTKVEDEVNNSGGLSVDNDIFDILPENLLQSIREKEKKTLEVQDPAISQAKRRFQMIASLPKLFDTILFLFQSIKRSVMTKEELMNRIVCSHLDIVDRREVEEQLKLLQELIPEWMYEKLASSGDILLPRIGLRWISKTPEKPADHPGRVRNRRTALSVKEVREAAVKLQKSDRGQCHQPDKVRSDGNEVGSDPSVAQVGKSKKKLEGQIKLPEKFEILGKFFDSLDSSIRLLRLKGSGSTFANISPKMECLTDRRFSYGHLAQLKFILPEVIEIKKILVHDEKTSCMKLDLHVTLNVDAIKNERKPNASGNSHMRKVFHARLLDFFKAHPKGEVPEETLPEPFNQLKQDVHISTAKASDPSLLRGTLADALEEQQPAAAASHLSQSFRKRFSQKVSRSEAVDSYQGQPIVSLQPLVIPVPEPHVDQSSSEELTGASASKFSLKATTSQKCLSIGASRASILRSLPSATPKKEIGFGKNKVCSSVETAIIQGTPARLVSTPLRLMSATPALQPQKRCYMSPDDDSTSSPRKLVTRKPRSRSLKFDTPVKNTKVEDEVNHIGGLSVDNDIFDILPENLLQSIREKEKKTLEEQDPAISQAKRRYQMIASLPKLFDMILFLFQSIKRSVMTKEELMHRIVCSHLDIVDRREVEEQLKLLQELIPEWMYVKLASSGDILVCINKISSPELMRARLVEAKLLYRSARMASTEVGDWQFILLGRPQPSQKENFFGNDLCQKAYFTPIFYFLY